MPEGPGGALINLDYRVLGPIEVWADGRPLDVGGARQRRVLGALVLAEGRPVNAERLIDIVWVGAPPEQARNTLRTYIARARRALESAGEAPLLTDPNGWRLERAAEDLDSTRFESLLATARTMSADPIAALGAIEEALSLWRGDAFEEFADEDWCSGEAARLDQLRLAAEEERFEAMLACGLYEDANGELERFIERHPLRDRPRAQQMVALYRAGRQVEAVRRFQEYRRFLDSEVGLSPSDELRALEQRIINRDASLRELAPAGRQLRGYQLGPQIGQGEFGRIYRASQPALGREVAIKVIRPDLADDPDFIRRFDGEAKTVAQLEHPHIVPLFDYWREPGGAYLVMRYLKGGTAAQLLDAAGPIPVRRASRIVDEIGGALATAHAAGVVHRDVKPANILFDEHGSSYLADFGIATMAGTSAAPPAGSTASAVYASPEQVLRDNAATTADIYAFGAVLFELLTGEAPFMRDTPLPELVERKRTGKMPRVSELRADAPHALDEVIARATAPDPADRFAQIGDLVVAFHSAISPRGERVGTPLGLAVRNPYKGLAAFDEADTADFFGREQLVEQLLDHLTRARFVAVVGPSGSGKSSVVRAGLAPRLRASGDYVVAMVPGQHPVQELTRTLLEIAPAAEASAIEEAIRSSDRGLVDAVPRCLPAPPAGLVLVIDQFEELFTASGETERATFLRMLGDGADDERSRLRVVVTVRADFYDRPLSDRLIGELVRANTVAVGPLSPTDLERAITEPARRVGVAIEPGLVAALVADSTGSPASLPLVQYQLTDLFERRDGDSLTVSEYRRRGGLGGAIARRADEIYDGYDESGRNDVRRLFSRLVAPGEGTDDTRRRVRISEVAEIEPAVIADYAAARLLTFDHDAATREPTIEVSHEALIREWPRLRRWIDNDRSGLAILRHLSTAANAWEAADNDPGELYRGARLLAAEEWAAAHDEQLNTAERTYLEASRRARDAQSELERRRSRRLRQLVASLAVIVAVAIVAGLVAVVQRRIADENAAEAERRALENRTSELTSEAMLALAEGDPDVAILLALAAYDVSSEISDTPQPGVAAALHETVQASRLERIIPAGYNGLAISPDGTAVALDHLHEPGRLGIYDVATGELVKERTLDEEISGLAYSPDGSLLAVTFFDGRDDRGPDVPAMLLLNAETLSDARVLDGGWPNWIPSWSADGRSVLASNFVGARVWSVDRSAPELEIAYPVADDPPSAHFVPGTDTIAVVRSGNLDLIDRATGEILTQFDAPEGVTNLELSPGATTAAFADVPGRTVKIVPLESDDAPITIEHENPFAIQFSPDGTSLSISGTADSVSVVELDSGDVLELRGHGTGVWRHAYSPDGDRLLAASIDGSTRVWNLDPAGPAGLGNLAIGGRALTGVATDSETIVSVETGVSTAQVTSLAVSSRSSRTITDFWFRSFFWPVFSPDGSLTAGFDATDLVASVIDVETGDTILSLRPCERPVALDAVHRWVLVHNSPCADLEMDPEAQRARQGFIDLDAGELTVSTNERDIVGAAVGPPGSLAEDLVVYTTRGGGHVVFRDAATGDTLTSWEVPFEMIPLALDFSPDGSALGMAAQTREGVVFDIGAIVTGASASDAVTVFEDVTTGPTHRAAPIGDFLLTSGRGNQIRLWDRNARSLLVEVPTEAGTSSSLIVLPDGTTAYYQDAGGVLRRFLTDVDDLADLARTRVQRAFTDTECNRYFPLGECPT